MPFSGRPVTASSNLNRTGTGRVAQTFIVNTSPCEKSTFSASVRLLPPNVKPESARNFCIRAV